MTDYLAYRAKIGVILPSTNTAVEYDLQKLNLRGVTWHPSRFWVEAPKLNSDDAFLHFLELIRDEIPLSVRNVLTAIGNSGDNRLSDSAHARLNDPSSLVRGAAIWALAQLAPDEAMARRRPESDPEVAAEWAALDAEP